MKIRRHIPLTRSELFTTATLFLLALAMVAGSRLSRLTNTSAIESDHPVSLYLTESTDLQTLGSILADSGVVDNKNELIWAGKILGWRTFHQGHYQIDGAYSYNVLLSRMSRGIQDPVTVTILPGLTRNRVIESVSNQMRFDTTAFVEAYTDSAILAEMGMEQRNLIGRMFPDTYSFYWNAAPETVLKRILNTFQNNVVEAHQNRFQELDRSVGEIVTLASIIEWEAKKVEEKPVISGLYWNRLERRMYLQADPTVIYALGERRRLLYEDYQLDHPYNTYQNLGLPPGPITNPSLSSIIAALYPDDHDFLFMVANPEGYHIFSETFEEHKKESEKWRKWLREQYRIKRERESSEDSVNS